MSSQRSILRLCEQVGDQGYGGGAKAAPRKRVARALRMAAEPMIDTETLTNAEREFCELAASKGKAIRGGWPDFLLERPGKPTIGVEVKDGKDELRPSQVTMLAALERAGLQCFVWNLDDPGQLVPWRKYLWRKL